MDKKVPNHVGLIPDGMRRWAKKNGESKIFAYSKGMDNIKKIGEYLYDLGVDEFSIYGLSWDNFDKRDKEDIGVILKVIEKALLKFMGSDLMLEFKVSFRPIGFWWQLPFDKIIRQIKIDTEHNKKKLNLCLNYTYRKCRTPNYVSDIDLLIRTGGYHRLSSFMLDKIGYSTFLVSNKLFPDFTIEDLKKMIRRWQKEGQNYGR